MELNLVELDYRRVQLKHGWYHFQEEASKQYQNPTIPIDTMWVRAWHIAPEVPDEVTPGTPAVLDCTMNFSIFNT
jgi:hypothetical protein